MNPTCATCKTCGGLIGTVLGARMVLPPSFDISVIRWCLCPAPDDPLRAAAKAVVDRWDTPLWKDVPATAIYIEALRRELKK